MERDIMAAELQTALAILRLKQVKQRTGLSRSTIYAQMARREFPQKVTLGARSVGWIEHEIDAHLRNRNSYKRCAGQWWCRRWLSL
jgi:prophage regulatory protein